MTSEPAESLPPDDTAPVNPPPASEPPRRTTSRIKIGSQRPNSPQVKARPQSEYRTTAPSGEKTPVPSIRGNLPPDLEAEVEAALGGLSIDEMIDPALVSKNVPTELEPDSRHMARVVSVHRDDVFVEMGGRNQGVLSAQMFGVGEIPEVGTVLEVVVSRFNPEDGLYILALPGAAAPVEDWSQVSEGMVVEARVTGHNKGGLECEVSSLRGFIPAGQISTYRIDDFSQMVGERLTCVVTEVNPERRNLVLSHRAIMEREKAAVREKVMGELAEGQEREGVVRSLQDFGAFVDLGGVDGLIHVSQMAWQRVKHPSEVLEVGQTVRVKIRKIDPQTGKISLSLRDLVENPWNSAGHRFPVSAIVTGTVTRIMDFGAFVELEPGVEGLVHISELAHGRVWRVSDVVQVGQTVEAKVMSIDVDQQRIGLSMKAVQAKPEPVKKDPEPEEEDDTPPSPLPKLNKPLKGGLRRRSGGEQFGLKW